MSASCFFVSVCFLFSPFLTFLLCLPRTGRKWQNALDKTAPHTTGRWAAYGALLLTYFLRVWFAQGWYIITYGLGIYMLNLFIGFLTPRFDPAMMADDDDDAPGLPTSSDEDFKVSF